MPGDKDGSAEAAERFAFLAILPCRTFRVSARRGFGETNGRRQEASSPRQEVPMSRDNCIKMKSTARRGGPKVWSTFYFIFFFLVLFVWGPRRSDSVDPGGGLACTGMDSTTLVVAR